MLFASLAVAADAINRILAQRRGRKKEDTWHFDEHAPLTYVQGKKLINQEVLLDKHSYRDCVFQNVTFVYNGTVFALLWFR